MSCCTTSNSARSTATGSAAPNCVAAKPSLVFCNLGAFGATGPLRDKPGYDPMMQAYSGLMSLLGEDGRPPVRVPASIIDMGAGMWSVIGILAALQERGRTGKGGVVDTSLYETGACLDEHLSRRLSRQSRNAGAARLGGRYDRAVSGVCGGRRVHDGGGRQRQSVPPPRRGARPARPRRGPAVSQQQGPGRQPRGAGADPVRHFCGQAARGMGASCSTPRASRTGRSIRSTRSSPTRRPQALGIIQTSRAANSALSACRCRLTGSGRLRQSGAGARRRQREDSADDDSTMRAAAPLLLAGGAGRLRRHGGRPVRRHSGSAAASRPRSRSRRAGRPVHRADRAAAQHAEPFLGVAGTNFYTLRTWIDRRTGETVHQLYVSDSYAGPPRDWNAARDAQGRPLRFIPISKNEITCQPSCSYAEEFAAAIPSRAAQRDRRADRHIHGALRRGENDRSAGRAGPAQVTGLDRVRAGLATAAAAPAPPRP